MYYYVSGKYNGKMKYKNLPNFEKAMATLKKVKFNSGWKGIKFGEGKYKR